MAEYIEEWERKRRERAVIVRIFEQVEVMEVLPAQIFKKLKGGSGLWEIRVRGHRFLGFYDGPGKLVLVHAFPKKTQKTPLQEIELAKRRAAAYIAKR